MISSVEFVLGYLWARPAEWSEVVDAAMRVPSPLIDREGVEAVLRSLEVQGLITYRDGKLILEKKRLHPTVRRAAQLIARDLQVLGVV